MPRLTITERGRKETCLGSALQIKVFEPGYRPLSWTEVCEAFNAAYPGRWAVQVFPPREERVDGKAVYHLWVLDGEPQGLNLRS